MYIKCPNNPQIQKYSKGKKCLNTRKAKNTPRGKNVVIPPYCIQLKDIKFLWVTDNSLLIRESLDLVQEKNARFADTGICWAFVI